MTELAGNVLRDDTALISRMGFGEDHNLAAVSRRWKALSQMRAGTVPSGPVLSPNDRSSAPKVNVARFDFVTIRLAVLCADLGSLSAASRQANCSISASSQRLKGLEDTLGRPLFDRDHRGLQLTSHGKAFIGHARAILRELDLMLQAVPGMHAMSQ